MTALCPLGRTNMIFRLRLTVAVLAAAVSAGLVAPLAAQSLAEVAKKEEDRRKQLKEEAKVITNKDLAAVPASSTPAPEPSKDADKAGAKDAKDSKDKDAKDKDAKDADKNKGPAKDQAYWASQMKNLRAALDKDQSFAQALQTRINVLTADFSGHDDPLQRAQIGRDRDKAIADLESLKKAIDADKKAIADLLEDARRAGVPPGWLR